MHHQGTIGGAGMVPSDGGANPHNPQGGQHFGGAYTMQQDGQQQMVVGSRMMRPMAQMNAAPMTLAQQQQSPVVGRLVQQHQQQPGPMIMQTRPQGPGVVVVSMPASQQQPGLPRSINCTETELRVLQALPEGNMQRLLSLPDDQRKQWIRRLMVEMQQNNKINMKNSPSNVTQQQWGSQQMDNGGAVVMAPPHASVVMDQQQHYSASPVQSGFSGPVGNQQFAQQQRYVQRPHQQQAVVMQPAQMTYRVTPRSMPTLGSQQQQMLMQQFSTSPGNFGLAAPPSLNAYASLAAATIQGGPSPGAPSLHGPQQPSPGYGVAYGLQHNKAALTREPGSVDPHPTNQLHQAMQPVVGQTGGPASAPGQSYGGQPADDSAYHEKIRELQAYLDHLKRTLEQQRDGTANATQNKIHKFVDILEGRQKVPYEILLKCEEYLKSKKFLEANADNKSKISQPLLEAVASLLSKSTDSNAANEIFKRTFDFTYADIAECKRIRPLKLEYAAENETLSSDNGSIIPPAVEREIAFLECNYKINLIEDDQRGPTDNICLACQIEDEDLPLVPPLLLKIPRNYPLGNPRFEMNLDDRGGTCRLFEEIKKVAQSRFSRLGNSFTITAVLNAWESSLRHACHV